MWWDIVPKGGLVFLCMLAPHGVYWVLNKLGNNGKYVCRNYYATPVWSDYYVYLRDRRITGSEYIPQGLEAIPDEQPCP